MKNLKRVILALAVLAAGTFAFAETAAQAYLSKFTELVTTAESCAKNKDGSKAAEIALQKEGIDSLRKTVTLSTTQRFSDWRLTKRYDSAYAKIKAAAASSEASQNANKVGSAIEEAAGTIKESTSKAVKNAKDNVKGAIEDSVSTVKDNAKNKVDETVNGAKDKVGETVTGASEKAAEKIQEGAESLADKLNKLFSGNKSE